MIGADAVFSAFDDFMLGEVEATFRAFVRRDPTRKWLISGDFVLSGAERANDTFAFAVFRYDKDDVGDVMREARAALPRDLKDVKWLDGKAIGYLASRERFHFCFLPDRTRHDGATVEGARQAIEDSLDSVEGWKPFAGKEEYVSRFRHLRQEAKRKRFPVALLNDITLLAALAACIAFHIAKHSDPQLVALFLDRDKMTTGFQGIATWLATANLTALCARNGMDRGRITLLSGYELETSKGRPTWFDDLVRPADYIAGGMARWDIPVNVLRSPLDKYVQLADEVIGENPHVAVGLLHFDLRGTWSANARIFRKENTNRDAYKPGKGQYADYLASQALRDWTWKRPTVRSAGMSSSAYVPIGLLLH